ncbi:MAG: type VI secretion system contractile sheath small subunit [Brucella intermedia]
MNRAPNNVNDKLSRVRKPRVHIKYDVETEDALASKELPFIVGVMGDFAGASARSQKPLAERKFVQIDRDNFDDVLKSIRPTLEFRVENKLANDGTEIPIFLEFNAFEDFEPAAVARQVPALKALLEARNCLRDILSKADRSQSLESLLEAVLQNDGNLRRLANELGEDADTP